MNEQYTHFSKRIKELRKTLNLSQEEFGKRIGVAKTTICNYEKGVSTPTMNTLENLSLEFNLTPSYFVDEQNSFSDKLLQNLYGPSIPFVDNKNIDAIMDTFNLNIVRSISVPLQANYANDHCVATTVSDNSLNKLGIKKGTVYIINKDTPINDKDIIAVIYKGKLTLRRYHDTAYGKYIATESTKTPMSLSREPAGNCDMIVGKVIKFLVDAKNL